MQNGLGTSLKTLARRGLVVAVAAALSLASISAAKVAERNRQAVAPAPQIEAVSAITPSPVRQVLMEVTAYCPCTKCCGPKAQGITASGKLVSYNDGRFVAADTKHLPFGTKLSIPGYHSDVPVEVIDRGGAIKGNKLDVFFATHQEALEWGRRSVTVTVLQ